MRSEQNSECVLRHFVFSQNVPSSLLRCLLSSFSTYIVPWGQLISNDVAKTKYR